ncbi:hypothetical protein QTP86_013338 [Hemibagrus guttatus]|nr:hypothetical protein QTP86_013338 [Hemibagrus guttatus]
MMDTVESLHQVNKTHVDWLGKLPRILEHPVEGIELVQCSTIRSKTALLLLYPRCLIKFEVVVPIIVFPVSTLFLSPISRTVCVPSPARRIDPATSASGGPPLQITSPITDPAELHDIVVRQGTIIRSYQDQVAALQTQLSSACIAAPRDPPSARSESPWLALPEKFDGSADHCRGFLQQCEVFFSHQPGLYREEVTKCAFLLSLMTDRALEWASAVWEADPQVKSSFARFAGMIREVFEYPAGGKDISLQLMELRQGSETAADYAIRFRTLATQSGWNDAALWAVFHLQAELACHMEATSLSQFVATSIRLDNLRRQHHMGTQASASARLSTHGLSCTSGGGD